MYKLPKKQFWYCWCGRFIWTDSTEKLTHWLYKHHGSESKCQKYWRLSPLWWYNKISLNINSWYWGRKLTVKSVHIDEDGVTSREIKP